MQILIVDDNDLVRSGLLLILSSEAGLNVVGECRNGYEAIDFVEENNEVELILMDVSMPKLDGIKATREIKKINKEIKVIMLSMHDDDNYIKASKEAGADGYIIKSSDPSAIIEKVKQLI